MSPIVAEGTNVNLGGSCPIVPDPAINVKIPLIEKYVSHIFHEGLFVDGVVSEGHQAVENLLFQMGFC